MRLKKNLAFLAIIEFNMTRGGHCPRLHFIDVSDYLLSLEMVQVYSKKRFGIRVKFVDGV